MWIAGLAESAGEWLCLQKRQANIQKVQKNGCTCRKYMGNDCACRKCMEM